MSSSDEHTCFQYGPILYPAPPAETSNESMSVENNAPPSPCSRGYHRDPASGVIIITRQRLKPDEGINCIRERLSGSMFTEPKYLGFDSRPTETDLCAFGCNRNLAETQISVTAVTVTRPKLRFRLRP